MQCAKHGVAACAVVWACGCGWWSGGGSTQTAQAAGQIGACIVSQVLGGSETDPAAIAAACAGATVADVGAIVASLISYYEGAGSNPANAERLQHLQAIRAARKP